jgi:hypothetical protein
VKILNILAVNNSHNSMSDYQDWGDWHASGNKPHTPKFEAVTGLEEEIFDPTGGSLTLIKHKRKRNTSVSPSGLL